MSTRTYDIKCYGIYRRDRLVVQPFQAKVQKGSAVVLIGRNGVGKSTLLEQLAMVADAISVEVKIGGAKISELDIGWLPQRSEFHVQFRVDEIVMLGRFLEHSGFPSLADRRRAILEMRQMDVDKLRHRMMGQLSGGEQQRVLISRVLASDRKILVLDEPTSGLDIEHAKNVQKVIKEYALAHGAVFYSLHDLGLLSHHQGEVWSIDSEGRVSIYPEISFLRQQDLKRIFGTSIEIYEDKQRSQRFFHILQD